MHVGPPSAPGHDVRPWPHADAPLHLPLVQVCPPLHALPHAPQFFGSLVSSAHVGFPPSGAHSVPALQLEPHAPFEQTSDAPHA